MFLIINVPEHMFHPHAQLRVLPVDGLLPFADLLASGVPLDHLVLHPELPHHPLHPFADVGTVGEQILSPVFSVLFACVVLARCLHEAPVYHGALMQDQVVLLQEGVEFVEQLIEKTFLCQFLLESPYCFLVGHLVAAGQSEEIAEREPVADLVFRLRVAEMVYPLLRVYPKGFPTC